MTNKNLEEIFDYYFDKVFGYFYKRLNTREDVEDLTVNSLRLFLDKYKEGKIRTKTQHAYLWRICYNQLINFVRNKSKIPVIVSLDENWVNTDNKTEDSYSDCFKLNQEALDKCMQKNLDKTNYKILKLAFLEEKNSTQIGQKLAIKPATVRQKLKRALQKVRIKCVHLWQEYQA